MGQPPLLDTMASTARIAQELKDEEQVENTTLSDAWSTTIGLLPSTIISHRTSVASVLHHWKYDPAVDPHIKLLIRAFRLEWPVQCWIMPKWDLHLILSALMSPPFASEVDDRGRYFRSHLWSKIADDENSVPVSIGFSATTIISPCAKCRIWQVCILKRKYPAPKLVSLLPEAGFFGQEPATVTGSRMNHSPRYGSFQPGWTRENVMSVQTTQAISKGYRKNPGGGGGGGGHQRLSIHWNRAINGIMRSHISKWTVETVKEAYTRADRDQEDRVTAHEVRALSASWAYNCQVALPDILSAAYWRLSGVFPNSYLHDMASIADGMSTLGPVGVAQ